MPPDLEEGTQSYGQYDRDGVMRDQECLTNSYINLRGWEIEGLTNSVSRHNNFDVLCGLETVKLI